MGLKPNRVVCIEKSYTGNTTDVKQAATKDYRKECDSPPLMEPRAPQTPKGLRPSGP